MPKSFSQFLTEVRFGDKTFCFNNRWFNRFVTLCFYCRTLTEGNWWLLRWNESCCLQMPLWFYLKLEIIHFTGVEESMKTSLDGVVGCVFRKREWKEKLWRQNEWRRLRDNKFPFLDIRAACGWNPPWTVGDPADANDGRCSRVRAEMLRAAVRVRNDSNDFIRWTRLDQTRSSTPTLRFMVVGWIPLLQWLLLFWLPPRIKPVRP